MAPNNPNLVMPGCPTCGADITATDLADGVYATPRTPGRYVDTQDLRGFPCRADSIPEGWRAVPGRNSPEHDLLTLAPCGHQLEGRAAHLYNLAALNLTYPDVRIELHIELPAALNFPDRREPRIITKSGTWGVAEFGADNVAEANLAARIHATAAAAIAMLGIPDTDSNTGHVRLREWGSNQPVEIIH